MKRKQFFRLLPGLAILLLNQLSSFAQTSSSAKRFDLDSHGFVENLGQFDDRLSLDPILYGFEGDGQQIFLSGQKVYFNLYRAELRVKTDEEKAGRAERKRQGFDCPEAFIAFQKEGRRFDYKTDLLEAEWIGANANAQLVPGEVYAATHSYEIGGMRNLKCVSGLHAYQKVTYRNLYPNIDVEYTLHPKSGVKYNLILHPGADVSQVRLRYSKSPMLQNDGSIATPTRFGNVLDHPPHTFYKESQSQTIISYYAVGGNEIRFILGNYDRSKTVVIDPWTDLPNDPGSNWNSAWECETDASGNSYAIFGAMPMRLRKYNAAGAIQWTYNTTYDTTAWLGTFVTDDAGNSYVTNGSNAALRRVSTAGALVWSVGNNTGQLLGEYWNIAFNCNQTRLITGGTGGAFNPIPYIYEINMANGALISSRQIHQPTGIFAPSEVRAVTATENAKYYWLSHDSIGYINQSYSACPGGTSQRIAHSGYGLSYKCENWRYNNTGIEAIAYHGGFVYINRGNRIDKRNAVTTVTVATAPIPGGGFTSQFGGNYVENSGIVISNTGRIFVGSKGSVSQFNTALTLIGTYAVTGGYNVYDVDLTSTGEVIACGSTGTSGTASRTGYVESLGALGAAPYAMPCCDASICAIGPLCNNGGPVTLTSAVAGGTWSSSAPGFNAATGVFNPTTAGVGSYTFYNTVACGVDSIVINVIVCSGLSVCVMANGNLQVSGSPGPFTWQTGTMVASCPLGPGPGCTIFTNQVLTLTWTTVGSGTILTPPVGTDTLRVYDASLTFTSWNIATLPPCSPLPTELLLFEGSVVADHTNALRWITSSDENLRYYTIERSSDAINFEYAGTVPANTNSASESTYTMLDENAHFPLTYYRLGETDMNGHFRNLSTIAVRAAEKNNFILEVFPVPAINKINFTYTGPKTESEPLHVRLHGINGAVVLEKRWSSLAHNSTHSIDISTLSSGIYEMSFRLGAQTAYRKVLVMRD